MRKCCVLFFFYCVFTWIIRIKRNDLYVGQSWYVCMYVRMYVYVCVGEELKSKANLVSIGQLPQMTAFHYE